MTGRSAYSIIPSATGEAAPSRDGPGSPYSRGSTWSKTCSPTPPRR
ncbi:MAG: hypothetical protein MZV63_64770 [Marinilabiliales bacterium]|nr:hypothetical protein [Marinilabiliales bacterium]